MTDEDFDSNETLCQTDALVNVYNDDLDEEVLMKCPEGEIPCVVTDAEVKKTPKDSPEWEVLRVRVKLLGGEFEGDILAYEKLLPKPAVAATSAGKRKHRVGVFHRLVEAFKPTLDINPATGLPALGSIAAKLVGLKAIAVVRKIEEDGLSFPKIIGFNPLEVPTADVG